MVFGALGSLSREAIRELARNLFPGFYDRGISANEALKELRGLGLGYRRQDFLNDFRQGESVFNQASKVRFVGGSNVIGEGILESQYHGVPDKYSFVFKASGLDPTTGEAREQYFFYHRNTLDTRSNLEGEAQSWISEQSGPSGIEAEDVDIIAGYINPLWE